MEAVQSSIDWNGPLPSQEWGDNIESVSHIEVPQVYVDLPDDTDVHDCLQYNPLAESQSFGLDIYLNVVISLQQAIQ
jgi:hypothetical protein